MNTTPQLAASSPETTQGFVPGLDSTNPSINKTRIFASPLARRIAADKGVSLNDVTGSGPYGRILRRDVEVVKATSSVYPAAIDTSDATASSLHGSRGDSYLIPNSQMRKVIARACSNQSIRPAFLFND